MNSFASPPPPQPFFHEPNLVEFAEVGFVHRLVAEHPVHGKILLGGEAAFLVGRLVQHLGGDGSGVGAQQVFEGFFLLEHRAVTNAAVAARL